MLAHFDDYVVGRGRRTDVAADGQWWLPVGVDRERNEYIVRVGNQTIELRRAAAAGHRFAQDLEAIAVAASRD